MLESSHKPRVKIKSVALPSEHGGWGFLVEPILLGLMVAGSWQGVLLAVAALGVFMIHQPLKIAVKDRRKGNYLPRTTWADRFVIGYGLPAILPILVLLPALSTAFWLPLVLAVPAAAVQLYFDARNQSRRLLPEVCGAAALAMVAPAIALLGGWEIGAALVLWLILTARALTSILYVRARLKLEHAKAVSPQPVWLAHGVALLVMVGLAAVQIVPRLTIFAFFMLLVRAWLGLSRYRKPRPAKIIGLQELGYGLTTIACVALGYGLNL